MAIRKPLKIFSTTQTGVADIGVEFDVPQDVESLIFKLWTAATVLDAGSVDIYVQTTDDGGTTWYDCGHFIQVTTAEITKAAANWMVVPVSGTVVAQNANGYVGVCTAKSIAASKNTGLPILDRHVRIYFDYATAATNGGVTVDVYGSQSGGV